MNKELRKLLDTNGYKDISLLQKDGYYQIVPLNKNGERLIGKAESIGSLNCFYGNITNTNIYRILEQVQYFINYKNNCNIKIKLY